MFTSFHSIPKPPNSFNLFFLDHNEALLSSIPCKLKSAELDIGKLHLTTRALYFQPQEERLSILAFKLTDPSFQYSANEQKQRNQKSPKSKAIHSSLELKPALIVSVKEYFLISRKPVQPAVATCSVEEFVFEINRPELNRLATEIGMIIDCVEEEKLVELIFSIRYKGLISMIRNSHDFDANDLLLHHEVTRVIPEGKQLGAFILTTKSLHFYGLINARPNLPVHLRFKTICRCLRFRYLQKDIGISIYTYSSKHPMIFIFENLSQRENIYTFLANKIKFVDSLKELADMQMRWVNGNLSNFEYLLYLNTLSNRNTLDISQYPVFPWVVTYFGESLDLENPKHFRNLAEPVGAFNSTKYCVIREKGVEYPVHYSNPSIVMGYLVRRVPEFILREQNWLYGTPEKVFQGVEESFRFSYTHPADLKELIPEFFCDVEFLLNTEKTEMLTGEIIPNVKLPLWAKSPHEFIEKHRLALESDIVSEQLHHWIDLIFGCNERGEPAEIHNNLFQEICYEVNWAELNPLEKEAYTALVKDFGVCPLEIFSSPHPQRQFRKASQIAKPVLSSETKEKILWLYQKLNSLTYTNAREYTIQERQYKQLLIKLKKSNEEKIRSLREENLNLQRKQLRMKQEFEKIDQEREKYYNKLIETIKTQYEKEINKSTKLITVKSVEGLKNIEAKKTEQKKNLVARYMGSQEFKPGAMKKLKKSGITPPKIRSISSYGTYKHV